MHLNSQILQQSLNSIKGNRHYFKCVVFTIKALNVFYINHGDQRVFFQMEIIINVLVSLVSDSFEYLCYGSTIILNIFTLTMRC